MASSNLIVPQNFIQATRDSGYKSLGSAIAELIDNSFEAKARKVAVSIVRVSEKPETDVHVSVADDGIGMDMHTLQHALQFGWSSRFNLRESHGRYGMGLPNASLSHARRVEVMSSTDGRSALATALDVDEIMRDQTEGLAMPQTVPIELFQTTSTFKRGTVVQWRNSDRLLDRKLGPLTKRLRVELGRLFRYQLWAGKTIVVNGESVLPIDPLFVQGGFEGRTGGELHGGVLTYPVKVGTKNRTSTVHVKFSKLPVSKWYSLSNEEKNRAGIAKSAGITIVRAGREIDHGWFFMGSKRKENYDDWWRCEVSFEPELDELFGVTHTKQEIHPSEELQAILTPDMERIARDLNGMARRSFTTVKRSVQRRRSEVAAERYDNLMEPPKAAVHSKNGKAGTGLVSGEVRIPGLQYRIDFERLDSSFLYRTEFKDERLTVTMNAGHPFVREVWPNDADTKGEGTPMQRAIELILLAIARTELVQRNSSHAKRIDDFRRSWSSTLATFLS